MRFALSVDGSKLLYRERWRGGRSSGSSTPNRPTRPIKLGDGALNLGGMRAEVDPPQEWKEIFNEVWRQERDYFFEASMNGVDWQKSSRPVCAVASLCGRPLFADLHHGAR